jgi:hypothetical protein
MPSERPATPDLSDSTSATASTAPARGRAVPDSEPPASASIPPASETDSEAPSGEAKRGRFESRLPGMLRRGIEKSIEAGLTTFAKSLETGRETTEAVRERLGDVKMPDVASAVGKALQEARLPREIAGAVLGQIDETKNDVVRIIAREVREFLDATDLAGELKAALTSLSFEVRMEVRFIPNDKGTGVRPDVRSRGRVKRAAERRKPRKDGEPDESDEV